MFDILPHTEATDLAWFASARANEYVKSRDERMKQVFGFARALANGFAFLARYDAYGNGARFVGYDMNLPLTPGTIILDATADIDGLSLIAKHRSPVVVPQVDFRQLTITHIDPEPLIIAGKRKKLKISDVAKRADQARPYAQWILDTAKQHTRPGEQILITTHKALLDHEYLPSNCDFSQPYDLEGRQVCFIHWGVGIGSNRWKDATAVFLFGEFHKPRRTMVAAGLGWREQQATESSLAPYQCWNRKDGPLLTLQEGDLCRWLKQMAMRGNARKIDADGVCGAQRLYVTGEFDRLIRHKDRMFPGATVIMDEPGLRLQRGGTEALVALLYGTQADIITVPEVKEATGVDLQHNRMRFFAKPAVKEAIKQGHWDFMPGAGRGRVGCFIRTPSVATDF
ncbi:hypothetical protein ACVWZ4_003815 [Bradyrhizobium sp. USDA 4472]